MTPFTYVRLIGFAAGTLLHLFLLVLILGYRRPRAFERVLFFAVLAQFLFYSGALLDVNAELYYAVPPGATLLFAALLMFAGLSFLAPLLVHVHAEYFQMQRDAPRPAWLTALVLAAYLPVLYFGGIVAGSIAGGIVRVAQLPGGAWLKLYAVWFAAALALALLFELHFVRRAHGLLERRFHGALAVCFALLAAVILHDALFLPARYSYLRATAILVLALLPSALLGYSILRYKALQLGGQRSLIYAVSAAFLALLYLSVVRRVGTWLEHVLPPEATASIFLFVLVGLFEPLQRYVGGVLHRSFQKEMDRLQRLTTEFQQEARRGDLKTLLAFCQARIRDEFDLAEVRLALDDDAASESVSRGRAQRFILRTARGEIGRIEAAPHGALLSGETFAALEFLAEQLPASIDLCRLIQEKLVLERELAERERMAVMGQMAASISHNLKNPLGSMKTLLQVQLENPDLPESLRRDCRVVLAEVERLSAKLGQLLRYAKPSVRAGGTPQCVAALALAEQMVALLGHDAERRRVRLEFAGGPEEIFVRGSEEALSDILSNLVVNAIEALPAGGSVRVCLRRQNDSLVLSVRDDGPGIPEDVRGRIFQPFVTSKPSGTGLGLAIVERRVEEMEGRISWQSPVEDGRGTEFTVVLSLAQPNSAEATKEG